MWRRIRADQDKVLQRCVAMAAEANPRSAIGDPQTLAAQLCFEVGTETAELYYFAGDSFEACVTFRYRARQERHTVCFGAQGDVTAAELLEQFIQPLAEYTNARRVAAVYGFQPRLFGSELLRQVYDLASYHPRIEKTLHGTMSDKLIYRLRIRDATEVQGSLHQSREATGVS